MTVCSLYSMRCVCVLHPVRAAKDPVPRAASSCHMAAPTGTRTSLSSPLYSVLSYLFIPFFPTYTHPSHASMPQAMGQHSGSVWINLLPACSRAATTFFRSQDTHTHTPTEPLVIHTYIHMSSWTACICIHFCVFLVQRLHGALQINIENSRELL